MQASLKHALKSGRVVPAEVIALIDEDWYLKTYPDVADAGISAAEHFMSVGWAEGRNPNPLFDTEWYFRNYSDVENVGFNPLTHYVQFATTQDLDPHPLFNTRWYLHHNPDVKQAGINPLLHYLAQGQKEGRQPHNKFGHEVNDANKASVRENSRRETEPEIELRSVIFGDHKLGAGSPDHSLLRCIRPSQGKTSAIYTAIFGSSDYLKEPDYIEPDTDYYCFTDRAELNSSIYKIVVTPSFFADTRMSARALKLLPHIFLPGYERTLWVDGSTRIRGKSVSELMRTKLASSELAVHRHSERSCAFDEAAECLRTGKDNQQRIDSMVEVLLTSDIPIGSGLAETAQVMRRNSSRVSQFNLLWWKYVRDYCARDQLSFGLAAKQSDLAYEFLDGNQWLDPYFKNELHTPNPNYYPTQHRGIEFILVEQQVEDSTGIKLVQIDQLTSRFPNAKISIVKTGNAELEAASNQLDKFQAKEISRKFCNNSDLQDTINNIVRSSSSEFACVLDGRLLNSDVTWIATIASQMLARPNAAISMPIVLDPNFNILSTGYVHTQNDGNQTLHEPYVRSTRYRHSGVVDAVESLSFLVRREIFLNCNGLPRGPSLQDSVFQFCSSARRSNFDCLISCEAELFLDDPSLIDKNLPSKLLVVQITPAKTRNPFFTFIGQTIDQSGDLNFICEPNIEKVIEICRGRKDVIVHLHQLEPFYHRSDYSQTKSAAHQFINSLQTMKNLGAKFAVTKHNPLPHNRSFVDIDRAVESRVLQMSDQVFVLANGAAEKLKREFPALNVLYLPHPAFIEAYPPPQDKIIARQKLGLPEGHIIIGSIGEIKPYKGIEFLVEGWTSLISKIDTPATLLIAGNCPNRSYAETLALSAPTNVRILPKDLTSDELSLYLSAIDASAFAFSDTWVSGSAILSLSYQRPVIAPDVGYLFEYIQQDNTGFLYKPNDIASFADEVISFISSPYKEHYRYMCRTFVEKHKLSDIAAKYTRAYKSLTTQLN